MTPTRHEEIVVGSWRFYFDPGNILYLSVAHCGGVVDTVPRNPAQQAWAEAALAELPGVRQVSPTFWEVEPSQVWAVRALLATAPG
jgi:hypothetical protein